MRAREIIGFDRKLALSWLDAAAAKAAEGADPRGIQKHLLSILDELSYRDAASGSARAKTVRVLLRIWGAPDDGARSIHDRALELLPHVPGGERLAIHWAMTVVAYPFFSDHAEMAGKLLAFHETISVPQLQRRIIERWGDRSTVLRTSRHVLRTMVEWGVLADAGKGVYRRGRNPKAVGGDVALLLIEAALRSSRVEALAVEQALSHPALFPFAPAASFMELRTATRLQLRREGLDREYITLRGEPGSA